MRSEGLKECKSQINYETFLQNKMVALTFMTSEVILYFTNNVNPHNFVFIEIYK